LISIWRTNKSNKPRWNVLDDEGRERGGKGKGKGKEEKRK
jgi:hypothetical protein